MNIYAKLIAEQLQIGVQQVAATLQLIDEGCTIPFIARYRKERTGQLDEVQISAITQHYQRLLDLQKRKDTILSTIDRQGKLDEALKQRIEQCWNATQLEDIYLPYKPHRQTRAQVARQHGLEPLAVTLLLQRDVSPQQAARPFVKGDVEDVAAALKGAQDIIAEQVSEDERSRQSLRSAFRRQAVISSKAVKAKAESDEAAKYSDYFDWHEPLRRCSGNRLLAMRRGESEGFLRISISPDDEEALQHLHRQWVRSNNACSQLVAEAVDDAYKRLLKPAIETEFAAASKQRADEEAIHIFTTNLRQLLLAAPLGQKRVMGIDPGFRTGCKVVCLDAQGQLLHHEAIFPHPPVNRRMQAMMHLQQMIHRYQIEAVAIGNGTASRETRSFVLDTLSQPLPAAEGEQAPAVDKKAESAAEKSRPVQVFVVSEDGASIYSASKVARDEFPDEDVTVRGAVSIARRLMDPLAELVKIEPKSIGVGQYQHDVDQAALKQSLDETVQLCVNQVGVNVNTASTQLLQYVSGLGPALAKNIVDYRSQHGPFLSRAALKKVPRLGPAAYQQCAGFLRIPGADNPLDNSAVHPESYGVVEQMARDQHCSIQDLVSSKEKRQAIQLERYISDTVGMPTLTDILRELEKPGRDPREALDEYQFDDRVQSIEDLEEGMELSGIVTNITAFGAFVDIGVHQDGLVHVSQMANRYVSNPSEVVKLHQHVRVRVTAVDLRRGRISLTMKF